MVKVNQHHRLRSQNTVACMIPPNTAELIPPETQIAYKQNILNILNGGSNGGSGDDEDDDDYDVKVLSDID